MGDKETFNYTYSAKERLEIQNIRKKYETISEHEDKMNQLRRLDKSVSFKAMAYSLAVGIVGALIMGLGMSLTMSNLSEMIGIQKDVGMFLGVAIGIIGIILICSAYPLYYYTLKKERKMIASEIIRLSNELMK